jgi:CRISPR/Cas system-associated endonuclease Cas1
MPKKLKLVLNEFGLFLGRRRNRYIVKNDKNKKEILSSDVEQIHILNPGITVSISALRLALKNQTLVVLADRVGWPHGFVTPAMIKLSYISTLAIHGII